MAVKYGIDVSEHNGDFNFTPYTDHFVIIRMGLGRSSGQMLEDEWFRRNLQKCSNLGIPIGLYFFSYAKTASLARDQADWVYEIIKNMDLPYGIWVDIEDDRDSNFYRTPAENKAVAQAFCQRLKDRGIRSRIGIYASASYFVAGNLGDLNNWYRWVAAWGFSHSPVTNTWIWQFTSEYRGLYLDGNQYVGNDPSGGDEPVPDPGGVLGKKKSSSAKGKKSLDRLVLEIFQGKWGNGSVREKKLTAAGYNYRTIQNRVNAVYRMAKETIAGKYGNGAFRKKALGKDYDIVQDVVNILLK